MSREDWVDVVFMGPCSKTNVDLRFASFNIYTPSKFQLLEQENAGMQRFKVKMMFAIIDT